MRKFGLIGYPLGHSFSHKYFSEKFTRENITDCSYNNYPLKTLDRFPHLISEDSELYGLNVTIPYKTEILKYVDETGPEIKEIGAINVLKIKRIAGQISINGYNSDVTGIRDSLISFVKSRVKSALILGTGGSSRAVRYVLAEMGLKITLVSRKDKPGCITYKQISPEMLGETDIIVNTTPLGMYPDIITLPDIDYSLLNENHILFDLVYNPEITSFLKMGQERGCKIITGMKMLCSQAERSWEIWNDNSL
jgi:shikimate dehydrogenase